MSGVPKLTQLNYESPQKRRIIRPLDAEEQFWQFCRLVFRIALFIVVGFPVFRIGKNYFMFGKPTYLTVEDFVKTTEIQCVPTVRGMKQYMSDTGQFPDDLRKLVPKYISELPWGQSTEGSSVFVQYGRGQNEDIIYDLAPGAEGWKLRGKLLSGAIPVPIVTTK